MTGIEWTDEVWNPVVGCSKVSAGCEHCYAETMDRRLRAIEGAEFRPWHAGNAAYNVRLHPERLTAPLRWKKPRRVFVNSMSDLFHEQVPDSFLDQVFAVMALARQHTFQCLTKRPERMLSYLSYSNRHETVEAIDLYDGPWPLPNVWLGVSVEDQAAADERIPDLLATPAAIRFLSCEPLLGPVDLQRYLHDSDCWHLAITDAAEGDPKFGADYLCICNEPREEHISQVIVGGESGAKARPCDLAWVRDIIAQCRAARVACFVKQLGARILGPDADPPVSRWILEGGAEWTPAIIGPYAHIRPDNAIGWRPFDPKGGRIECFPADLRVREWPEMSRQ